jgi:hypothetical protein
MKKAWFFNPGLFLIINLPHMFNPLPNEQGSTPNSSFHILLTPNTFQNCHSALRNDHVETLGLLGSILASRNVTVYMTEYDSHILSAFNKCFRPFRGADIYEILSSQWKLVRLPLCIGEEARLYDFLSSTDAVRIAVSLDLQLDAVVTWEPHHFIAFGDHQRESNLNRKGYFHFDTHGFSSRIILDESEDDRREYGLRVFSVKGFHDFLLDSGNVESFENDDLRPSLSVEDALLTCRSISNSLSVYSATVYIRHRFHGRKKGSAVSPINDANAIMAAINSVISTIEGFKELPPRTINHYLIETSNPITSIQQRNRVSISFSCGDINRLCISSDASPWKAMANCYCRFLCDHLGC